MGQKKALSLFCWFKFFSAELALVLCDQHVLKWGTPRKFSAKVQIIMRMRKLSVHITLAGKTTVYYKGLIKLGGEKISNKYGTVSFVQTHKMNFFVNFLRITLPIPL